ncbi:TIGR01777 family oxidoreductase [Cytophagaceae bacterium ABcell3]|nr:TIGR01777 family oxidoreductase [Cytophagaceae bacterium ABcell3]
MGNRVLITGGSGMIGRRLTELLQEKGYTVHWLSRSAGKTNGVIKYPWNIEKKYIEDDAILKTDYIIHLAGANIFEKRWTDAYKKVIIESRTKSANLLLGKVKIFEQPIKAYITASGIDIYDSSCNEKGCNEQSPLGTDFLAEVCKKWEACADQFEKIGIRTVKIRTGVVLSESDGAFKKILSTVSMGIGAPLGSGKQYFPWIHLDDLCNIYIHALENEKLKGAYNACAPEVTTNKELTKQTAKLLGKPMFMPNVPAFALKLAFGAERAELILGGKKASPDKISKTGFKFKFPQLKEALGNLLNKNLV